ncbi:ArsR/SmtB family transcription factor [Kordiimonas sp.]|uniref:ArsR/SmtB family transcription factor n=1 Tax=Kordiimonas sp. TaxID=1970157 RepID=UPI003A8E7FB1
MVNYIENDIGRTFAALTDPNRRAMLLRLEENRAVTVSELAAPLPIKLPAVMKHLDVLEGAGLISRAKEGRTVTVHLTPQPMEEAMLWLRKYEHFWSKSLDRLVEFVEGEEK